MVACCVFQYVHLTLPIQFILIPDFVIHNLPFLPALAYIYSPLLFPILQHIYLVVLCCVSEDKADVLLYNEVCIHVNEMVKSTKGSMFIIVFINIRSYVPGIKASRGLQLWQITSFKKLNFMLI